MNKLKRLLLICIDQNPNEGNSHEYYLPPNIESFNIWYLNNYRKSALKIGDGLREMIMKKLN